MRGFQSFASWTAIMVSLSLLVVLTALTPGARTTAENFVRFDQALLAGARVVRPAAPVRRLAPPVQVTGSHGLPPGLVLGYLADSPSDPDAVSFVKSFLPALSGFITFWYTIDSQGAVSGGTNTTLLKWAAAHRLWTFALVRNNAGASVFTPLLASPTAQAAAIQNLLNLVTTNDYSGVNLDWEGIAPADRDQFTAFVQRLTRVFHRHGKYVTLSIPAETQDDPADGWTGAYDYAALGKAADLLMIMAYDQHNTSSAAGPVASPSWVEAVLKYAVHSIPPDKVVLGVPGYGYVWSADGNAALTWSQAEALAKQYGQSMAARSGHFQYTAQGVTHTVYFENETTFLTKVAMAGGLELGGIALWRLGIEDPGIWNLLG
jgi:spore germination protein